MLGSNPSDSSFQWRNGQFVSNSRAPKIIAKFIDIVGFVISLGLVFLGYSYGKSVLNHRTAYTPQDYSQTKFDFSLSTPTPSFAQASLVDTPIPGQCPDTYKIVTTAAYSTCIPDEFSESVNVADKQGFTNNDGTEELVIYHSSPLFPLHVCNFEQQTTWENFNATRILFHEQTGAGCGALTGFALRVVTDRDGTYTIHLVKHRGVFENEQEFNDITQSFKLTK